MGPRRSWSKDKRSRAHDVLDMKGNKAADQVRGIIEAMHATELRLPSHDNDSRLLIREGRIVGVMSKCTSGQKLGCTSEHWDHWPMLTIAVANLKGARAGAPWP